MVSEQIGYVSGNPTRVKVLNLVHSKREGITEEQVRKSVRLPVITVKKTLNEMVERELLVLSGEVYMATELGEKVTRELQSFM